MVRFNADKVYYDESVAGISPAQINHDDSKNFDAEFNNQIIIAADIALSIQRATLREVLDIDIISTFNFDENYSSFIDLMQLIPSKFRDSVLLQQYVQEVGTLTGTWLGYINDLLTLLDKYSVSEDYLQNLADLVDLKIVEDDTTSLLEKRRQLIQVIEWYKMKGTYQALRFIGYLLGMEIVLWDLYTNDYVNFVEEPWFVGYEDENPGGLNNTYYKSPHIGFEILLTTVFGSGVDSYLFSATMYNNLFYYVEISRPINVVPHYALKLTANTDQTGNVITSAGNVRACVVGTWNFTRLYFDNNANFSVITTGSDDVVTTALDNVISNQSDSVEFDDGKFFDYTDNAFYNSITRWKVGTGSKGIPPANVGWTLQTIVLSGLINSTRIYSDRVEYEFVLPNTVTIMGISELGLYLATGDVLTVGCTFPNIDILPGISLKVLVTVQRA